MVTQSAVACLGWSDYSLLQASANGDGCGRPTTSQADSQPRSSNVKWPLPHCGRTWQSMPCIVLMRPGAIGSIAAEHQIGCVAFLTRTVNISTILAFYGLHGQKNAVLDSHPSQRSNPQPWLRMLIGQRTETVCVSSLAAVAMSCSFCVSDASHVAPVTCSL